MRQHLNEYLFSPLLWVLTLFLLVLLLLVVLLLTPAGAKMIALTADSALKELTVKGVSGTLLSGLHIDEIIWDDGDSIALKNVDLKIQNYNLAKGRLVAKKVTAERLTINLENTGKGGEAGGDITSLPDFGLPLNMNAHIVQLDSLRITQDVLDDPEVRTLLFQIRNIQLKKVTINDGILRFRRLQGNPIILDEPLRINVTEGRLNMNQPHDIRTSGNISYHHPKIGDVNGELKLSGTLTNYDFDGEVIHAHKELGKQRISLLGQGNYKRVHLEKLDLNSIHGKVSAKGRILWDPEVRWAFLVEGNELTTQHVLTDWPATINTVIRYSGNYIDSRLENNIQIVTLTGTLRDYELALKGDLKEREGVITTDHLALQLGTNKLVLSGKANEPFNLKWSLDAQDIKQLLPPEWEKLKLAGRVKGDGILKGWLKKPTVQVDLVADHLAYKDITQGKEPILLKGDVAVENDALLLKNFLLKSGRNVVKASGQASAPFDLKLDIEAQDLSQLSPQLTGIVSGNAHLTGTSKKPDFMVKLSASDLAFKELRQGDVPLTLDAQVSLKQDSINIQKGIVKSGVNTLTVSGVVSEPLVLTANINATDLSQISPELGGVLQGDIKVQGKYQSPKITLALKASQLRLQNTRLGQNDLHLKGEIEIQDGVPIIKNLISEMGNNRLQINGKVSSPYDLTWELTGNKLSEITPDLQGELIAKGRLQGDIDKPIINANASIQKVKYKDFAIKKAEVLATTNQGNYRITGELKGLKGVKQEIDTSKLDVIGSIDNHVITLSAKQDKGSFNFKARGGWSEQRWKGVLQDLSLKETPAGNWRLQKPAQLQISKESFNSSRICLVSKDTQACATSNWSKTAGLTAKGKLQQTPLSLFSPWLPDNIRLNGTVNGVFDISQNNANPSGQVNLTFPNSSFSIVDEDGEAQTFGYKDAKLIATIKNRTINVKSGMNIVNRGKLSSDFKIHLSPENGKHTIKGVAKFDVPNINWAQDFIPHSRGLRGQFTSKLNFSGPLNKPRIIGKASLKKGYLRLPEAGTEISDININLRANKPGRATLVGKMRMGQGLLNVTGKLDFDDLKKWKSTLKVKGTNIRFMNTNEVKALMSPDLMIGLTAKDVSITGKILIPEADIHLKDIPETSIDESEDTFVVGERKPTEQVSAIRIKPDVVIQLGDKVKLNAFGLRAKLSGSVKITHNRSDILAIGSLRVTDGKFQAYGQDLEIKNGRLIFNGSPKIVGMDIRATRKIDDILVGVHLGGTLLSPKSKIFSDPPLPESEALSYLLTGHSLSTSSGKESALLMSAVRGLGITGSNSLIHNIGASLGLDDVNIVTKEDFKKSELALGKRLGPRLYVRYLIGLFDQTQKIAIEYKINKVLSLEIQSSAEDYGLDFIYEIERD